MKQKALHSSAHRLKLAQKSQLMCGLQDDKGAVDAAVDQSLDQKAR